MKKPQPKYQFNYPTATKDAYLRELLQKHMDLQTSQDMHRARWLTRNNQHANIIAHTV
jgi:hypothetical protein